jgi:CheY-like chemotaxis protein
LQKLEAVGRLAGGVAHDFNNLLSVIAAYASTLHEQAPQSSTARDDLEQIQIAAERGTQVTRQLLAFSRRDQWQPHSVDLNRLVRGSKKILAHIVGARIVLSANLSNTLYPIFADPSAIEQVILNLVLNAHDAMPNGGNIWIETSNAYLGNGDANHITGPHVMLSIRDNGSGMSPETLARIYEPFFTTKPAGKGTGLGLALVRSVVQRSGGQITVDSALGRGTTFTLRFPRDLSNTAAATKKALPPPKPGAGETLLVVDDDPSVLRAASDALARFGYRVLSAVSAEQAEQIALHHKGPLQLLLTDVVMPKENGPDLARSLRARIPGLRVVYMSSYGPNTSLHYGVSPFGPDYLSKPFNAESLARIVRHSLDQPPPPAPPAIEAEL